MGNKATREVTPHARALERMLARPTLLEPAMFELSAVGHHGLPSNTKAIAYCGRQGILAIGTARGNVKLYGRDGLEVMLPPPPARNHLTAGVVHMKFTAHQRLVVSFTDSSIRVLDLAAPGHVLTQIPESWTMSTITCIETITYLDFPYIFVALDDGNIHVFHEETGKKSTYVISPRDMGITTMEEDKHTQQVTAMASNPRNAGCLLIGYDASSTIFMWDFAKSKLTKEFQVTKVKPAYGACHSDETNSVQSLAWHSNGKRFVVGFKYGGIAIFRADKSHGFYHMVTPVKGPEDTHAAINSVQWICPPPSSRQADLPGAVIFSGGRSADELGFLTILSPPSEMPDDDALSILTKSEQLAWQVSTVRSGNKSDVTAFAVSKDQVDYCSKIAPLSVMMLSGDPLDGCQPSISVQCLPCFIRLCDDDKEGWEWVPRRLPPVNQLAPPFLQCSPLRTFTVVCLAGYDGTIREDLMDVMKECNSDPMMELLSEGVFEWPVNGGSVLEPLFKGFVPTSTQPGSKLTGPNDTLLLTGHENGHILFWELVAPSDLSSKGTLKLIHVVNVIDQIDPIPENPELSCLAFCHDSRSLVAGFTSGQIAVMEFRTFTTSVEGQDESMRDDELQQTGANDAKESAPTSDQVASTPATSASAVAHGIPGFHLLYSLHIHSSSIKHISYSSKYNFAAVADESGVVSLVNLSDESYELLIFDISSADPVSVDSLLLSELTQLTEIPNQSSSRPGASMKANSNSANRLSTTESDCKTLQHQETVPVLFVGRGNGNLEMFHVQSATKIGALVFDPEKLNSLSTVMMVDTTGCRYDVRGRAWENGGKENVTSCEQIGVSIGNFSQLSVIAEESDFTRAVLQQAIQNEASGEPSQQVQREVGGVAVPTASPWIPADIVETNVPAGSMGLHLSMDVEQHALVIGFAPDSPIAMSLQADGVRNGHIIVSINGVDLLPYTRSVVCAVLEKLRNREKVVVFASGFPLPSLRDVAVDEELNSNEDMTSQLRYLVCACGKSIDLVQAALPDAFAIASGQQELPVEPLTSVELAAPVLTISFIRVPVLDRLESCLAAIDQTNRLYIISLMSLQIVASMDCHALETALDGILCDFTFGGELVVANALGEIERYSLFSDSTARECAALEKTSAKINVLLDERRYPFGSEHNVSPKKKTGIADAGKMFKRLVSGVKEVGDLNKIFHFSSEESERDQLMGNRSRMETMDEGDENTAKTKAAAQNLGSTKDALAQAAQHLHERGDKLNDLALKTEQMKDTAHDFHKTMKAFNENNANKKWYEF